MTVTPEPTVTPTEYLVCCLPLDDVNADVFAITVSWRGGDTWAVKQHSACLGADGTWDYEPIPSSRTDEWLAAHRFDLETALRLAKETAPHVTVNRWTVIDALAARERNV